MKQNTMKKVLSVISVFVLFAAMAWNVTGCSSKSEPQETMSATTIDTKAVLGEGSKVFYFVAVDLEGNESKYEIHSDATFVGEALIEHSLIDGDDGEYGLYVKTVNGITLDWDKDAKYWSFLVGGDYAMTGCDMTEIEDGVTYTFLPAE